MERGPASTAFAVTTSSRTRTLYKSARRTTCSSTCWSRWPVWVAAEQRRRQSPGRLPWLASLAVVETVLEVAAPDLRQFLKPLVLVGRQGSVPGAPWRYSARAEPQALPESRGCCARRLALRTVSPHGPPVCAGVDRESPVTASPPPIAGAGLASTGELRPPRKKRVTDERKPVSSRTYCWRVISLRAAQLLRAQELEQVFFLGPTNSRPCLVHSALVNSARDFLPTLAHFLRCSASLSTCSPVNWTLPE